MNGNQLSGAGATMGIKHQHDVAQCCSLGVLICSTAQVLRDMRLNSSCSHRQGELNSSHIGYGSKNIYIMKILGIE
jgi:hypothetical protein